MTKVYDVFLFFDELDLLEIRLNLLDDYVDYFVISECDYSFSGKPKPFYYENNKERFSKFNKKIIHIKHYNTDKTDFSNKFDNPTHQKLYDEIKNHFLNHDHKGAWSQEHWRRDFQHREFTKFGLINLNDDDIVIFGDVDEIPNPKIMEGIQEWCKENTIYSTRQKMYHYYLNLYSPTEENWWGTKIFRYGIAKGKSIGEIRLLRDKETISIFNGGWHFTSIGNVQKILNKIENWGHQEYNNNFIKTNIESRIKDGKDIFFRSEIKYIPVQIEKNFPKYFTENKEKFSNLILDKKNDSD